MAARSSLTRTESAGGSTTTAATSRARRRRVVLPPQPAQDRRRRHGVPQAAGRAVLRARCPDSTNCPAAKPNRIAVAPARPGRGPGARVRGVARARRSRPPSRRRRASPRCSALDEPTVDELAPYLADADPGVRADRRRRADRTPARRIRGGAGRRARRRARRGAPRRRRRHPRTRRGAARPGALSRPLLDSDRSRRPRRRRLRAAVPAGSGTPSSSAERWPTTTTGCGSRRSARWCRVDDADGVAAARSDANREVRIAVANGLGTLGTGARHRPRADRGPRPAGAGRRAGGDGLDRLGRRRRDDRRGRARPRRRGRSGRARPGRWPGRRRRRPRCRRCRGRCPTRTSTSARPPS